MRIFALVVAFTAVVISKAHPISHEDKEKLLRYHKDCIGKTGVEEKLVDRIQEGEFSEEPRLKEYLLCLSQKLELQNEVGELQIEVIKKKLYDKHSKDEAEVEKLIEKCAIQRESPTETAYNIFKCYRENTSNRILFYVIPVTEEKLQKLNKYRKECAEETQVDMKLVEDARRGVYSDDSVFKQYVLCVSKKAGFQNGDGNIQIDVIKEKLTSALNDSAKAENLINICVTGNEKETSEDTALAIMKCICEKVHLNYLQPFTIPKEKVEKLMAYHKDCLVETSVDEALIEATRKGNFSLSEDGKLMDYFFCLGKKAGFQDEDGKIQKDVLKQKLTDVIKDPILLQRLIEKCATEKDTPQRTAFDTVKCYYESTPNHIGIFQIITVSEKKKQKLIRYNNECQTESGVDSDTLELVKKGQISEDEKFKNHLLCFFKKLGYQNEAGEIQKDLLCKKIGKFLRDPVLSEQLVEKCAIQRDTPQNTAYEAFTCYYENTPSHFNIFALF